MKNEFHNPFYFVNNNNKEADFMLPQDSAEKETAEILDMEHFRKRNFEKASNNTEKEYNISEKIKDFLKSHNILIQLNGYNIFDFEEFAKRLSFFKKQSINITIARGQKVHFGKGTIFDALKDFNVISKKEYLQSIEKGKSYIYEKPLFNVPDSLDEAFDIDVIKSKEYYLNYWEIFDGQENPQVNWKHDLIAKNGDHINMKEFSFATKLFKDFQAFRGPTGELQVFDKTSGAYIKFGVDWAREKIGSFSSHEFKNSANNFFLGKCPNLVGRDLIRISDIRTKTESANGKLLRTEKFVSRKKPGVMIGGISYYIGKDTFKFQGQSIPTKDIKIVILDQNTAGVVLINGGQEKVHCLIDLLNASEKEKKRDEIRNTSDRPLKEKEVTARSFLNKKEMNSRIRTWRRTEDNPKFENETSEEYAERMSSVADYGYIKKVTDEFALHTGIGIHNLSWREQQWLVSAAFDLKDNYYKLLEFGKIYGMDGLRTFLSCEYGLEHAKEILRIGEKLSHKTAKAIFVKYNEISSVAEINIKDLIKRYFGNADGDDEQQYYKTAESLLKKSKDLLLVFSEKLKSNKNIDEDTLLLELEKSKTDTIFLTTIFKLFAKDNPSISFEDFKGLLLETGSGTEISADEKNVQRMIEVVKKNYLANEAMQKLVVESLEEGLSKENSEFYILRHNEEIVAFCRFDDQGDHFYAGSFNVDSDYRGSAIGEVMMRESLDKKAKEKPIKAIADPEKEICSNYVEDEGFIIGGILYTEFEGKTLEEVNIIRDDENNKKYIYRQNGITRENLLDIYQDQKNSKRSDILKSKSPFIVQFSKNEISRFLKTADKLCKEYGYVITRYFPEEKDGQKMFAAFEQKL